MKKYFVMAFVALSMSAFAQHVTPVSIEIADPKIDSLRTLYLSEPMMYRASLDVVAQDLAKNAEELQAAKAELKAEKGHIKDFEKSLKGAEKMAASLEKLYDKEEAELKSMLKVVENQQRVISRQTSLNKETREGYTRFLEKQQKELSYSVREVADRQRAITDLETSIQKGHTLLQNYVHEVEQKTVDLAKLEATYKERLAQLKAEQKTAKTMQ